MVFASSFINNNQTIVSYVIQAMSVLLITPILIYLFGIVLTQMFNISIINPTYVLTNFTSNLVYILVVNLLLSLMSFIFVKQQQPSAMY